MAPFLSSFLDAAAVWWWNGEDYWSVWRLRFLSNVLAQLGVVPAVAGLLNRRHLLGRWPASRVAHASAIAGGLILVALLVSLDRSRSIEYIRAPLAIFLPFLLWAAVRFGPAGVGLSVVAVVILAVESSTYGSGLFRGALPSDQVRVLQTFLIAVTVPLLGVAALLEERRTAVEALGASHLLKSSILASIPSLVAVINRDGRIVAANQGWINNAAGHTPRSAAPSGSIGSHLDLSDPPDGAPPVERATHERAARDGIRRVLDGSTSEFALEYPGGAEDRDEWWTMSAVPLRSAEGGAVITYTDITARKLAELEAQRHRDAGSRQPRLGHG
jgi:PAS domain-containing protein